MFCNGYESHSETEQFPNRNQVVYNSSEIEAVYLKGSIKQCAPVSRLQTSTDSKEHISWTIPVKFCLKSWNQECENEKWL